MNKANPHTVKKFELVAKYVDSWIHKLMNNPYCKEIVFIDCMCNNGIYVDDNGKTIEGTPIRVAKLIADAMKNYPRKKAILYFNDNAPDKIEELRKNLPVDTNNFNIEPRCKDGNDFLKELKTSLLRRTDLHYLLFYDPYKASINWEALVPYFFGWGEVIINHMVSDPIRAITSAKSSETISKYEQTYLTSIENLINLHGDKNAYDELIKNIIRELGKISKREYYLATCPFFIKTNVQIYSIIFFTKNKTGFKLFKTSAWKIFGGKSSNKNDHGKISLFNDEDKQCYYVSDIADYIVNAFKGKKNITKQEIWDFVDEHPIFPTDDYKKLITDELKRTGRCKVKRSIIDFA